MDLIEEAAGEVTIVVVAGRMDAEGAKQFDQQLNSLVQTGRSRLLIDLAKTEYVGSLGLRALLIAARLAAGSQGRLVLCRLTAQVRRVVELGGFGTVFEDYASREEALESFGATV